MKIVHLMLVTTASADRVQMALLMEVRQIWTVAETVKAVEAAVSASPRPIVSLVCAKLILDRGYHGGCA